MIDKLNNFHSGSVHEFPNVSRPKTRPGSNQSRMTGLSRDREEDVPKCLGQEISQIFLGKIWFPGNGIWERRPLGYSSWNTQNSLVKQNKNL